MSMPTPNGKFCHICSKEFSTRKMFTDHYRVRHKSFYITHSGKSFLVERGKDNRFFQCNLCTDSCGASPASIKSHYQLRHNLAVKISSKSGLTSPQKKIRPSGSPSFVEDVAMEDGDDDDGEDENNEDNDSMLIDAPPLPTVEKAGPSDPETDEDENWEAGSSISDASTEVLIQEDEDDVVPLSFNFLTHERPSDDCPMSEESPGLSEEPHEGNTVSPSAVYGSDKLLHDRPLCDFGYALNEELKVIICMSCHRGVPVDMVNSHSKNHHAGRPLLSSEQQATIFEPLVNVGFRTSKAEKYYQTPSQKPVDGLEVRSGFLCPLRNEDDSPCAQAFLAQSTFSRHLSSHSEPLGSKPPPLSCVSHVQTLFSQGGLQKYFSVDPSLSNVDPSSSSAYTYAVKMLESLPKPDIPLSDHDKDRASIDWFTRWPQLLQPYITGRTSILHFQSLVSFPEPGIDPDWLVKLLDHGSRWWKDAEEAHVNCSFRSSVMLKCHKQYAGPWKVLREPESARRYCGTAISFLSYCLKTYSLPVDAVPVRFTQKQHDLLGEYSKYLESSTGSSAADVENFQSALFCVLFREENIDIATAGRLSCPVQSYIALLSLRKAGDFVKAGLVTQPISRLLYVSRAAVLKTALRDCNETGEFTQILQVLCDRCLGEGEGKISDELISLKKYASTLALREPGDPNIVYDPEYTTLAFQGRNLSLCKVQSGLKQLIEDTWVRLLALTSNKKIKVELSPSLSEDIRSTATGDSFIDRVKVDPPTLPLLFEMSRSQTLSLLRPCNSTSGEVTFEVDPGAAQEFFHSVKPIVEAIAFLVHVTGSGPLRLSEVVDDRYRNGSGPRNLLVSHGLVFLLRRNLKSSTIRGCRSSVVHYPPPKVVELLIYYLAVFRPVEIFLVASLRWAGQHTTYSQFLYVVKGRKLSAQDLSSIVSRFTNEYFECGLTGSQLRHVFIDIQRVFLPPIVDPSVQKFGDSQAGHSSKVANRVYGQRLDHLPGEQASWFVLAHHWCKCLHTLLGLGPESSPIRPIPYLHAPPEPTWWRPSDYSPPKPSSAPEIMAQVHHGINSAISYANQELAKRCEKVIAETVFRAIAAVSAKTLINPLTAQPPPLTLDPPSVLPSNGDDLITLSEPTPSMTSEDEDLLRVLSLYTRRPGSTFTSENQKHLLSAILQNKYESVLAVMPTGSGKSIAIFGPILAGTRGVSIVITCYTALRRQLAEQAHAFGIKYLLWNKRNVDDSKDCTSVQLVIMITDDLFHEQTRAFLRNSAIVRIVLDEVHSIFLSESYRPKMQSLLHLREAAVQKVFLTATLVPFHEKVLADRVGISLARTLVLRSPTARPNHRLQIVRVQKPQTPFTACAQLISLFLDAWNENPSIRGIVFVRSVKKLQEFSDSCAFPIRTFYGHMTEQEKDKHLSSWLSQETPEKWMISTTALLHGIDYPHVNAVIFLEPPFGLYDFVQGAGRAGRGGQEALVTVLYADVPPPLSGENEHGCRVEMEKVLTSPACRRLNISRVMDGKELPCSKVSNALLCDFCEGRPHPLIIESIGQPSTRAFHLMTPSGTLTTPPATPLQRDDSLDVFAPPSPTRPSATTVLNGLTAQANQNAREKHAKSVMALMERFAGCFTCRIQHEDHRPCHPECGNSGLSGCSVARHQIYTCTDFPHKNGWIDWKKRHFRWPTDVTRCYFCGLPNAVAGHHSNKDGTYPGKCRFSDSALAAAWHILNTPHLFEHLQNDLGFTPGPDAKAAFAVWATQYGSESEDLRLLTVFSWLCNQYYPLHKTTQPLPVLS